MRWSALTLMLVVAGCAATPPPEPVVVQAPPQVVVVEKTVEKPVVIVKPAPAPAREVIKETKVTTKETKETKETVIIVEGKSKPAVRPPKTLLCRGMREPACVQVTGCQWIKHTKSVDKNGRKLADYCRKSTKVARR